MKTFWVYMLLCRDGSFYVGVTSNVDVRVAEHEAGSERRHYTYSRRPLELVYGASFSTPEEAISAEKQLKGWSRAKKAAMIRGDWNKVRELARGSRRGHRGGHSSPSSE
jgi:predicted GIY-YIG superfamily endonuclease